MKKVIYLIITTNAKGNTVSQYLKLSEARLLVTIMKENVKVESRITEITNSQYKSIFG